MPFNWRLQLRLAITNFVVVFIGVLVMKILLTPIGAYFFPANNTDLTSNDVSPSGEGSSLDIVNFANDFVSTSSQEITIGGTPIAATTDASGKLPDGGKYVELVDKGYSPMHIDLTHGLSELYQVVETVDGQVVYNETFRGEDAEGQYYAAMGNKSLHKRARTPWQVPILPVADMYELVRKGKNLYTEWMFMNIERFGQCLSADPSIGPDPKGLDWQRENFKDLGTPYHLTDPWSVSKYDQGPEPASVLLSPIKTDLETLKVGTDDILVKERSWNVRRNIDMNLLPHGPCVGIAFVQDKDWVYTDPNGRKFQQLPTFAGYGSIYNILDGVIVAQKMFSPMKMHQQTPPSLQKWSDVTWRVWKILRTAQAYGQAKLGIGVSRKDFQGFWDHLIPGVQGLPKPVDIEKRMLKWLNWIVIQNIKSPGQTTEAIQACLVSRNYNNGRIPLWGMTAKHLTLGIDNGQLADLIDWPSLLWEIKDANDPTIIPEKTRNEALWDLGSGANSVQIDNPQGGS
ncbi:hypothetical protein KC332_g247 [Hortaea werneckii]|nr:hypothetical protein KC358_g385 [Hortaea werneckii]KAI6852915.1 hypothetical protein KC350_g463 [Hortaea werneckii]KAI6941706.1 hypothetical protein KC348_g4653 [Hortaea werneckii]KAI6944998.1 hypothetical protein KC341_g409 [Hortaea werneckii]KAI6976297.1 hypothetical protein KC321_g4084 [Hortaea werneckii]